MKLCVTANILTRCTAGTQEEFREAMSFVKRAGFEEVDFPFNTPMMLRENWKEDIRAKAAIAKAAGVHIRYAHLPFDYPSEGCGYGWEEFETASFRAMDMAKELGADCAAIHPRTYMTREYDAEREREEALRFMKPYCEYAGKIGLALGLENMRGPGQSAPKEIRRFCEGVDDLIGMADELGTGICWDTGHANISAQAQKESLIKVGKRLKMVHINDNFAEDDVHIAPFVGNVDWNGVAEGLKAVNYQGSLNLEVNCRKLPEEVRAGYAAYMAAAAAKLRDMIG